MLMSLLLLRICLSVPTKGRVVQRKGPNKAKMTMGDIAKIFHEMEGNQAPIFVASNLANLPPVKVDCMENLKVLQQIEAIRLN